MFVDDLLADYIERIPTTSVEQTTTTVQTHESACIAADCVPVNSRRTGESSIDISHHKKASPLPDHVLMRTKPRDLPVYIDLQH